MGTLAFVKLAPRNVVLLVALGASGLGCVESTSGDMALIEVRRVQAEAQTNGLRLAAIEARQMYLAQQMSMLSGVLDTIAKNNASRDEASVRENEENEARIERLEKVEVSRRERERVETPGRVVERAQELIDAGHVKVTTKNGRARLEFPPEQADAAPKRPDAPRDLEDPWAPPRRPPAPRKQRLSDDLGF